MTSKNATESVPADAGSIAKAAAILERGGLVAVPTETVYGLAARADSDDAVARIFAAKGRPNFNPLIVHVRDVDHAQEFAHFNDKARELAHTFWPGPLTLVLPKRSDAPLAGAVSAGLPTIAVRAPAHPVMQQLLDAVDFPLAAPSANRSGFISPTSAAHVLATLEGRIDCVLDGGSSEQGLESTIVAVREDGSVQQLRPGPIDTAALNAVQPTPHADNSETAAQIEAPGQLASHYAPGKPVRLNAVGAEKDEFFIGFGSVTGDCTLSQSGDLNDAAARLYACLHQGAVSEKARIAVAPIPDSGIGKAINDRLRRAAA